MSSEVKANKLSPATGTDVTLGDSGDTFTVPSGATITNSGTASGFGLFSSYAIIADQKASAVDGGTFTSGAWRTRDLNTEITDPDGIVSIASDQFTLAAGTYLIKWAPISMRVTYAKSALYDVTGTAYIGYGTTSYGDPSYGMPTESRGAARVTIGSSNVYEIRHYCQTTYATYGFGIQYSTSGGPNQYCTVEIFKEA